MQPIKKDSLHLRLYQVYGKGEMFDLKRNKMNFCQYSRGVMWGFTACLAIVACGVLVGSSLLLQGIGSLLMWMITDNPLIWYLGGSYGEMTAIFLCVFGVIVAFVVAVFGIFFTHDKWKEAHPVDETVVHEPGFIVTWYKAWKEKYCPMVELEQEPEQETS